MPALAPVDRPEWEDEVDDAEDEVFAEDEVAAVELEPLLVEVEVTAAPRVIARVMALFVPQQAVLLLPQHQVSE